MMHNTLGRGVGSGGRPRGKLGRHNRLGVWGDRVDRVAWMGGRAFRVRGPRGRAVD